MQNVIEHALEVLRCKMSKLHGDKIQFYIPSPHPQRETNKQKTLWKETRTHTYIHTHISFKDTER